MAKTRSQTQRKSEKETRGARKRKGKIAVSDDVPPPPEGVTVKAQDTENFIKTKNLATSAPPPQGSSSESARTRIYNRSASLPSRIREAIIPDDEIEVLEVKIKGPNPEAYKRRLRASWISHYGRFGFGIPVPGCLQPVVPGKAYSNAKVTAAPSNPSPAGSTVSASQGLKVKLKEKDQSDGTKSRKAVNNKVVAGDNGSLSPEHWKLKESIVLRKKDMKDELNCQSRIQSPRVTAEIRRHRRSDCKSNESLSLSKYPSSSSLERCEEQRNMKRQIATIIPTVKLPPEKAEKAEQRRKALFDLPEKKRMKKGQTRSSSELERQQIFEMYRLLDDDEDVGVVKAAVNPEPSAPSTKSELGIEKDDDDDIVLLKIIRNKRALAQYVVQ